jgi:hypothetical protein
MFLLLSALVFGQQGPPTTPTQPGEQLALCNVGSLPPDIQGRLKGKIGFWKVQEPVDLSPRAHERWESEKPQGFPVIAVGDFESAKTPSYAILLVPTGHADAGYRFLVFSQKAGQPAYETRLVEK